MLSLDYAAAGFAAHAESAGSQSLDDTSSMSTCATSYDFTHERPGAWRACDIFCANREASMAAEAALQLPQHLRKKPFEFLACSARHPCLSE